MFIGGEIFRLLNIPEPSWYVDYVKNNKTGCFFVLFMINTFGANQLSTGAFEIYFNGDLVYSKLMNGRLPREAELYHTFPRY